MQTRKQGSDFPNLLPDVQRALAITSFSPCSDVTKSVGPSLTSCTKQPTTPHPNTGTLPVSLSTFTFVYTMDHDLTHSTWTGLFV